MNKKNYMYDVIISGYYGYNNSGDDAILMATIQNLISLKNDIRILVLSKKPIETKAVYGVDAIHRFHVRKVIRAMFKSKLFISGGGSLIQDLTSTRSLFYYLGCIIMAKILGMKVMMYANGFGPVQKKLNRYLVRYFLNKIDIITLREEDSFQEIKNIGVTKPVVMLTADPALTLKNIEKDNAQRILRHEGIELDSNMVGFSVRSWPESEKYNLILAQIADYVSSVLNAKPVFIPMQLKRDVPAAKKIVNLMNEKGYIIENRYTVHQTLALIGMMDMVVGMRLHALIYAASLGTPVVGLVYEPKVEGFLNYLGQVCGGHVNNLDYETFKSTVQYVWDNRLEIKNRLWTSTKKLKEKALENAEIAISLINEE